MRLLLTGLSDTGVRFNNDVSVWLNGNPNLGAMGTPADPSPYLFHPQGGSVIAQKFIDLSKTCSTCPAGYTAPGSFTVVWGNVPGIGTSTTTTGPDINLLVVGLTDDVCKEINRSVGLGAIIPVVDLTNASYTYGGSQPTITLAAGADIATVTGKMDFCFLENNATSRNIYISPIKIYGADVAKSYF